MDLNLKSIISSILLLACVSYGANQSMTYDTSTFRIIAPTNPSIFWSTNGVIYTNVWKSYTNSVDIRFTGIESFTNQWWVNSVAILHSSNRITTLEGQTNNFATTNDLATVSNMVVSVSNNPAGVSMLVVGSTNAAGQITLSASGLTIAPTSNGSNLTFKNVAYVTKNIVVTNNFYETIWDMPIDESVTFVKLFAQSDVGTPVISILSGPANTAWRSAPTINYANFVASTTGNWGTAFSPASVPAGYKIGLKVVDMSTCTNLTVGYKYTF